MSGRRPVRLVHTSDIHLGLDWRDGLSERAFSRVIDSLSQLDADALLVVGDVFDHARVPDRALEFYVEQIGRVDCPVVTLPGNHDLYHQDTLYRRAPFDSAPPNFHLITGLEGHSIALPDLEVDVWGRAMFQHTPDFKPLAGMPRAGDGRWLVALAHGHFHFPEDQDLRSSPILPAEVAGAPCHYLALGHWERHVDVSQEGTVAYYSGSPLGASPDDSHISVNLVDMDPLRGVSVRQVTLDIDETPDAGGVAAATTVTGGA